ncbi:MAG: PhnD/SsuA/transferrin family substrate-binding protein, partial [Betaproteobacteria bacterium]|nr:PhnD/SsuA/transferrin family substrate-binding protein [Betaproteobacteria bacterium]
MSAPLARADQALGFYVLNQRTIALAAQYWNPILTHVSKKSGVALDLKLAKTAQEGNINAEKGKYDLLYTNHFFTPERDRLGYKVIARPAGPGIRSEIVVPVDSPIKTLQDLEGAVASRKTVAWAEIPEDLDGGPREALLGLGTRSVLATPI